jgi:DNA modification methylase
MESFMSDNSVQLCLTDIPYGVVNRASNGLRNLSKKNADIETFDIESFIDQVVRVTSGSIYIFCSTEQVSEVRSRLVEKELSTRLLIWEKTNPSPMNGQSIWLSGVECCVYGKKKGATFNGHCLNTVLRYPTVRSKEHPTQKPLALMEKLIQISSNEGDKVFDPCMGSGTTGVAAIKNNRDFLGIEIDEEYYNVASKKLHLILEGG